VGIGGIDQNTIQAVAQTGVGSVAVVRAITGSDNPEAAVKRLTQLMMQATSK
jgi:thiamine-phosphate pyrophosphorylase